MATAILGETGYVYVIDGDGRIIAHANPSLIGATASRLPTTQPFAVSAGPPPKRFAESPTYESASGEPVSGISVSIPRLNWRVVAEWPQTETQALIRVILIQIGAFSLLSLLLLATIASWVAFRLIQPIAELRQGTSIIGGGNFNYRVDIRTNDELEDLGKNLNKMAENLKGLE